MQPSAGILAWQKTTFFCTRSLVVMWYAVASRSALALSRRGGRCLALIYTHRYRVEPWYTLPCAARFASSKRVGGCLGLTVSTLQRVWMPQALCASQGRRRRTTYPRPSACKTTPNRRMAATYPLASACKALTVCCSAPFPAGSFKHPPPRLNDARTLREAMHSTECIDGAAHTGE